jgi:sugar porter (SP) family MFS transporter
MEKAGHNLGYVISLSVVAAIGGFLFGYDTAVISGTVQQVTQQFDLNSMQVGWFVGCALVGSISGVSIAGMLSDHLGRKKTMILSALLFTVSAIGCAISSSYAGLAIYRIIGGIGIGIVSIVSPMYISEVSLPKYRGSLVSLYQLAITVGFLGAYLANFMLLRLSVSGYVPEGELMSKILVSEVWRAMFGAETLPALLFFAVVFFIPESPRWLVVRHSEPKAQKILMRILRDDKEAATQIADIRSLSNAESKSELSLIFRPGIFRAVMIGAAIAILGQFMGVNAVLYYGPKIFQDSGLSSGDSLFYQVLVGLVNMLTTVIALLIIDKVGRKKLVYFGVTGMIISLIAIGLYFLKGQAMGLSGVYLLVFFLAYIFCCAISVCAVIWVLLSEMYPNNIRGLAMSIAGFALWIGTYLIGQLTPWMLEHLTPAGTFFIFVLMCLPYLWLIWKRVPETTGKTLEEIERMWIKK